MSALLPSSLSVTTAYISARCATSLPKNAQLSKLDDVQKKALASQIRVGITNKAIAEILGKATPEQIKAFCENPDVQRKLVKGVIHGTLTEPSIIEAMESCKATLTLDACEQIWNAKSALMLDTFENRPETMSILRLMENLSVQAKREIANSCLNYKNHETLKKAEFFAYRHNLRNVQKDENFQKFAIDLIAQLDVEDDLYTALATSINMDFSTGASNGRRDRCAIANDALAKAKEIIPPSPSKVHFASTTKTSDSKETIEPSIDIDTAPPKTEENITPAKNTDASYASAGKYLLGTSLGLGFLKLLAFASNEVDAISTTSIENYGLNNPMDFLQLSQPSMPTLEDTPFDVLTNSYLSLASFYSDFCSPEESSQPSTYPVQFNSFDVQSAPAYSYTSYVNFDSWTNDTQGYTTLPELQEDNNDYSDMPSLTPLENISKNQG